MKVLFVDDEPKILKGIERMLYDMADEWDMSFAENGAQALEYMDHNPADIVVTDMRMPGMDGAELLKTIQLRFPNTVRIILSGHTEIEAALRALPVAHQLLAKPCNPELLKSVIERACRLQQVLNDVRVREVIGTLENLPSVPHVYSQLVAALEAQSSIADIAKIVSQDQAMSAKTLQLVNSSFFGGSALITNIENAVIRLGVSMIKNLILYVEVFQNAESFSQIPGFSIGELQKHALDTAALAKNLLRDKSVEDDLFMAAVLHDIGNLVMVAVLPEQLEKVYCLVTSDDLTFYEAEKQLMSLSHAEIGGYLLGVWGLPHTVVEAVANHHEPVRFSGHSSFGITEAVYVAGALMQGECVNTDYLVQWGVMSQFEEWQVMASDIKDRD